MKKINKILCCVICISIILSLININLAYAELESSNIVSVDEATNQYDDIADATHWSVNKNNTYTELKLDEEDNYLTFYHYDDLIRDASNGVVGQLVSDGERDLKNSIIAVDTDNRRKLRTDILDGRYIVDFDCDMLMKYDTTATLPYGNISLMNGKNAMLTARIRPTLIRFVTSSDKDGQEINITTPQNVKIQLIIDTHTGDYEAKLNGETVQSGSMSNIGPVSSIKIESLTRIKKESFLKFKNIKITQLAATQNSELEAMLDNFPEKLTANPSCVYDDIEIPEIDNVTWSTSNSNVISTDGKVTRYKNQKNDVSITGHFKCGDKEYQLVYEMTVAEDTNNVITYFVDNKKYSEKTVNDGDFAENIAPTEKENMQFVGWYDKTLTDKFDFNQPIYNSMSLYAKYEPKIYDVNFYDGSDYLCTIKGTFGESLAEQLPDIPNKEGYVCGYWIEDGSNARFTNDTIIHGDMKVITKYFTVADKKNTVTYLVDNKIYNVEEVYSGFCIEYPENPKKDNFVFDGWMLDDEEYDEFSPVLSDISLTAKFIPKQYAVSFYSDDELYLSYKSNYGEKIGKLPENPKKESYKFRRWETETGDRFDEDSVVTGDMSVFAKFESAVNVIYDKDLTEIRNIPQATEEGWSLKTSGHAKGIVYQDGGLMALQTASTPNSSDTAQNTAQEAVIGAKLYGIIEEDSINRTVTKVNKLAGKYQLDIGIEEKIKEGVYPSTYTGGKGISYAFLTVGAAKGKEPIGLTTGPITHRIFDTQIQSLNGDSAATATVATNTYKSGEKFILHSIIDTRDDTVTVWINDNSKNSGNFYAKSDYFDSICLSMMQRMGEESYVRFTDLKITELEVDDNDEGYRRCMKILDTLPDSLSDNPYNVTENLTFPEIDGVTWSTSNTDIVKEDGTVNRWYDDNSVTIYASVAYGPYSYTKEYTVDIAGKDAVQSVEIINKNFEE